MREIYGRDPLFSPNMLPAEVDERQKKILGGLKYLENLGKEAIRQGTGVTQPSRRLHHSINHGNHRR